MKKIKSLKRAFSLFLSVILLLALFSACTDKTAGVKSGAVCDYIAVGEDITENVKNLSEDAVLLQNGGTTLTMDSDGIIKVLRGGKTVWSTGISAEQASALGEVASASAAAVFRYHINGESEKEMDSFSDAYKKGQFRVYKDGNSVVYEQIAGDFSADVLLPEALSEKRYEEITEELSESDATFISRQYMLYTPETATDDVLKAVPNLKKDSFYVLMDAESFVKRKRLHETFEKAGYTSDDLNADRKEAGIATEDQGEVFKLVMRFTLENGELVVDIPCDQIYYPSSKPLVSLDLMKFGAFAKSGNNGSYIMPSGSGAVFSQNEGKTVNYTMQYGGKDYTTETAATGFDYSGHSIFGSVNGDNAYVAIIEEGEENVRLKIESTQSGYVQYPQLQLRSFESSGLGQTRKFYQYANKAFEGNLKIRYTFFEGEKANYNSMANRYREYLLSRGAFEDKQVSKEVPLQLEVINNLYMIKKTAGISYTTSQVVTTYSQTKDMLKFFKEQGIEELSLKLNGADNRGLFAQSPGNFKFASKAGGKKGYSDLKEYCKEQNIPLFLQVNMPFYYADTAFDGYSATGDTARRLSKETVQLAYKEKSTNADRSDLPLIEVVSPREYEEFAKNYNKLSDTIGDGISIGEFSRVLNSDYNEKGAVTRADAKAQMLSSLKLLNKEYSVLAETPMSCALAYVDSIEKMPLGDSGDNLWSYDIPLIPLALHGYIDYTSTYWNDQPDSDKLMLKAIEYGSGIAYRFAENVTKDVTQTHNNFLFNVNFELWKETVTEQYEQVSKALKGLNGVPMVSHEYISKMLVKTVYEDGTAIYVNYGNSSVKIGDKTVKALSYLRVK